MKTTPQEVIEGIHSRYNRTTAKLDVTPGMQPRIAVETDHGKADRIGQLAMMFDCVETYFACHIFRKASVSIYLKKGAVKA